MTAKSHLLLALTGDRSAPALVDTAHRLSKSIGCTWSVVAIETPSLLLRDNASRAEWLRALDRAQQFGASVTRISTGSNTTTAVVSALVHRASSEGTTDLLIGHPRGHHDTWRPSGPGLSGFAGVLGQLLPDVTVHLVSVPDGGRADTSPSVARPRLWGSPALRAWPKVVLALAAATTLGAALEQHFHPANIVILYLAGVVYVASKAGRAPAIATVLGGILLYDLIFVPPRWSLKPAEPQYWLAFAVMMVVGLIISQLAAQTREQALLAEARAQRTQTLNQLSVALGRARDEVAISSALRDAVLASTGATSWLMRLSPGRDSLDGDADAPEAFSAHWAGEALARGSEVGAGMAHGSDQALRYLPLIAGDAAFGVLVASPPAPSKDSLEDQHLLRALANQAAIALERAALERRSMAVAVEAEGERTRNTLLAGISHDFRTPLTTIVGSATLLVEQADAIGPSQRTSLLRTLLSEAQRLHTLTSNLLDLTRLDAGAVKPRPEWCPPDELVQSARSQLGGVLRDHSVTVDLPADAVVWCDATLIEQVLVNLLANAARHSPPGSAIGVKVVASTGHWTLSVHDNGPGIAPGQEQAIFQKFHRAPGDGDSTGKGLGLAICAAVADLHGGRIVAENDAGARFTMVLPQPTPPDIAQDALT